MNLCNLALRIDNNDNQMTFVGHIIYMCPSKDPLHPRSRSAWVQMMLLGPQMNSIFDEKIYIFCFLYFCFCFSSFKLPYCSFLLQTLMSAPLLPPPVTFTRNAQIFLAHTAVLATLATLVTEKHAQVRKTGRRIICTETRIPNEKSPVASTDCLQ